MESQKRKRNVNFSKAEEELLVELVMKRKEVIENKKTDAVMWKEKEVSWKELTSEFNSIGLLVPRTSEQLQLKYKNMKKVVRKKNAKVTMEARRTGGGSNESKPLDETEVKIKELIRLSVEGMPASFDADTIDVIQQETVTLSLDPPLEDEEEEQLRSCEYIVHTVPSEVDIGGAVDATLPSSSQTQDANISNQPRWDVVTPRLLQQRKSASLRSKSSKKQRYNSTSAEATHVMERKEETLKLQKKCLEQDIEFNEERKRNMLLERKNLRLEREKKKLEIQKLKLEIKILQSNCRKPKFEHDKKTEYGQ